MLLIPATNLSPSLSQPRRVSCCSLPTPTATYGRTVSSAYSRRACQDYPPNMVVQRYFLRRNASRDRDSRFLATPFSSVALEPLLDCYSQSDRVHGVSEDVPYTFATSYHG